LGVGVKTEACGLGAEEEDAGRPSQARSSGWEAHMRVTDDQRRKSRDEIMSLVRDVL
jgi:hypothetical protein